MKKLILFLWIVSAAKSFSQQTDYVDFEKIDAAIVLNLDTDTLSGRVNYHFRILKDVDHIFIDGISSHTSII